MKVLFFANRMPDLCGAFLHDIDLAVELQKRGHSAVFLTITTPKEGFNGGTYRGFRFMHYTAGYSFLETSDIWICPHSPILPTVRKINTRGYNRPIVATCHFDGNYNAIRGNVFQGATEMLLFINKIMETSYRKNITPFPSSILRTEVIRPIMHRENIVIQDSFKGDYITLVNANQNKGTHVFIDLARRMPNRKFLGVLPYYGELQVPPAPSNVEWIGFNDDIRTILCRTRILLVPSYYESFGRIAVEAMINGIPVLYSKPVQKSRYSGGSTEGMQEWIGDSAVACEREVPEEWIKAIEDLDNEEVYTSRSEQSKVHIDSLDLFSEASRISQLVESFSHQHPAIRSSQNPIIQVTTGSLEGVSRIPREPDRQAAVGFSNGRLRIRR
jgi:hypothetical protein